jgi:hypothetical protein
MVDEMLQVSVGGDFGRGGAAANASKSHMTSERSNICRIVKIHDVVATSERSNICQSPTCHVRPLRGRESVLNHSFLQTLDLSEVIFILHAFALKASGR